MAVTGRPSKLTPELQTRICDMLRAGNYLETAAAYAGVNKTTLYDWMKRGAREMERVEKSEGKAKIRKKEQPYVDFSNAIEKALAEAEVRDLIIISNAAKTDWKAAAWKLERKNWQRWGRKDKIDANLQHTGKDGGPIETEMKLDFSKLSDEELAILDNLLSKSTASESDGRSQDA